MTNQNRGNWRLVVLTAICLGAKVSSSAYAQNPHNISAPVPIQPPSAVRITLEEAKQRALGNNKLLNIGALNAEGKQFAIRAAQADYFPKVVGNVFYLHFNDDLGKVITTSGRTISGPRGRPLITFPATAVEAAVVNQDSTYSIISAIQPLTDLLKVRQGVAIARADQQIAQAELEKGVRAVASGVEQLYWGLLAANRIRAGLVQSVSDAEMVAKSGALEGRMALVETKQALKAVEKQVADVQEQLNGLLDLPLCTTLELVEPPLPTMPYHCADEVIGIALSNNPEIRSAQHTIAKAHAAVTAGKLDYVPSVALTAGYMNQSGQDYIQPNIGFVGVVGSYTFVDWGKRRNVIRERNNLVAMANLKLQQTQDDVRAQAAKAFREYGEAEEALKLAQDLVALRNDAFKAATTPAAMLPAARDRMTAVVDAIKAELAFRQAYVQVMTLTCQQ